MGCALDVVSITIPAGNSATVIYLVAFLAGQLVSKQFTIDK
jgi:hypothetical protein